MRLARTSYERNSPNGRRRPQHAFYRADCRLVRPTNFGGNLTLSFQKRARINRQIRAHKIRLIGSDGEQLGVVDVRDGQNIADEAGLDLVEVAPNADPPVCRVMDFGKYLYQEKKKQQEAKKKQKTFQVKEVKFRPMIDDHDFDVKFKRLIRFLEEGDKVKATVQFRGREMPRMDLGYKLLDRIAADVGERGMVESRPERAGRRLHQVISPPRKGGSKKGE